MYAQSEHVQHKVLVLGVAPPLAYACLAFPRGRGECRQTSMEFICYLSFLPELVDDPYADCKQLADSLACLIHGKDGVRVLRLDVSVHDHLPLATVEDQAAPVSCRDALVSTVKMYQALSTRKNLENHFPESTRWKP